MKRTGIIFLFSAVLAVFFLAGCGGSAVKKLNVYNWTYYIPDEVLDGFKTEFGVELVYDTYDSNEVMYAKLKAGASGYDIVFPSQDFIPLMIAEGLVQPLNKSLIPSFSGIDPAVLAKNSFDPGNVYSAPYSFGVTAIVYWKDKVPNVNNSWSILSRPELKGRVALMDDMREVLGGALKFLGYSVNTTSPQEIELAKDLVNNQWKPNVVKFDTDILGKGFASQEFWVAFGYPENVIGELDEADKDKVAFFIPKEGGAMYLDSMMILKDAKNVETAHQFINYILRPEVYAKIMDAYGYTGVVPAHREFRAEDPWYTTADLPNHEYRLDVGDKIELYNKAWDQIRTSN